MERFHNVNPFVKRETHSAGTVTNYKILTIVTWLVSVVFTLLYSFDYPRDVETGRRRIWEQNNFHYTAFSLNVVVTSVYWVILFILQFGYITKLFSANAEHVHAACSVGSHFILNNLLHFAFVMLFVRSHFAWAEVMLVLNFFNLSSLYARHNTYARGLIHVPTVSGPLAWTYVALFWNGAIMVGHQNDTPPRVLANIFIWSILLYGVYFLAAYRDYTMGFNLAVLSASLGVAHISLGVVRMQGIFAFVIAGVLLALSLVAAVPALSGSRVPWHRQQANLAPGAGSATAPERAPLLGDNAA